MTDMPTTYETHTATTSSGPGSIGPRMDYIKTIPGILKIVEMVLDVIVFICSVIPRWPPEGWIGFVSVSAWLTTLVWFLLYLFAVITRLPSWRMLVMISFVAIICSSVRRWKSGGEAQAFAQFVCIVTFVMALVSLLLHILVIMARFPGPWLLIEFIYYCVFSVFYLIAAIVAASYAKYHSSIAACTFFAFAATAIYAVDTYFQFRAWRTGQAEMTTTQTSTTTTTVHSSSHVEAKTTY